MRLAIVRGGASFFVKARIVAETVLVDLRVIPQESGFMLGLKRWLINRLIGVQFRCGLVRSDMPRPLQLVLSWTRIFTIS